MREQETHHAIDEQEIKNMELHLQRKMFEQELERGATQGGLPQKINYDARMKQHDLEDDILEKLDDGSDAFQNRMRKVSIFGRVGTCVYYFCMGFSASDWNSLVKPYVKKYGSSIAVRIF
jgi:hypothetical protein